MVDWHGKESSKCSPLQICYKKWTIIPFSLWNALLSPFPPPCHNPALLPLSLLSCVPFKRPWNAEEIQAFNSTRALLFLQFSSPDPEKTMLTEPKPFSIIAVWGNWIPLWFWVAVISRDSLECVTILRSRIMPSSAFQPLTWCVLTLKEAAEAH